MKTLHLHVCVIFQIAILHFIFNVHWLVNFFHSSHLNRPSLLATCIYYYYEELIWSPIHFATKEFSKYRTRNLNKKNPNKNPKVSVKNYWPFNVIHAKRQSVCIISLSWELPNTSKRFFFLINASNFSVKKSNGYHKYIQWVPAANPWCSVNLRITVLSNIRVNHFKTHFL